MASTKATGSPQSCVCAKPSHASPLSSGSACASHLSLARLAFMWSWRNKMSSTMRWYGDPVKSVKLRMSCDASLSNGHDGGKLHPTAFHVNPSASAASTALTRRSAHTGCCMIASRDASFRPSLKRKALELFSLNGRKAAWVCDGPTDAKHIRRSTLLGLHHH